ncbi:Fc.00g026210.m01.CDS01 [Cosmosporella sp. VM-42]
MSTSDGRAAEALLLQYIDKMTAPEVDGEAPLRARFEQRRISHVLIFQGCFNPPHIGHLNFLRDSFTNAGRDLNFVCAFVIPQDSNYLRERKFKAVENPLVLSRQFRAQLWRSDRRWPSWAGVLHAEDCRSAEGLRQLKKYARSLGFRIQFTLLLGAESCEELTCESLSLVGPIDNVLINLHYRHSVDYTNSLFRDLGQEPWQLLFDAHDGFLRYQTILGTRTVAARGFVRVIKSIVDKNTTISSTAIRNLCASDIYDGPTLCKVLPEVVLSWDILQSNETWLQWRKSKTKSLLAEDMSDFLKITPEGWRDELQAISQT